MSSVSPSLLNSAVTSSARVAKFPISPPGSSHFLFQGKLAAIHVIASAGATLIIGQRRTKDSTALTAESGCRDMLKEAGQTQHDVAGWRTTVTDDRLTDGGDFLVHVSASLLRRRRLIVESCRSRFQTSSECSFWKLSTSRCSRVCV